LHLDNSINWTPLYAAPVISAVSQPRRQGNEKMHMSIFKLIVGVIFNVAFFGVLLFCQQVLWIGGEEKRIRPLKENRIAALAQIAGHFGVHYSTVSRALKQPEWDTPACGVLLQDLTPQCDYDHYPRRDKQGNCGLVLSSGRNYERQWSSEMGGIHWRNK
jgi:hypothetical protein